MAGPAVDRASLLAYQCMPAVVLDNTGIIVTTNEGGVRLLQPSQTPSATSNKRTLVGHTIEELEVELLPRTAPIYWTWKEILGAARHATIFHGKSVARDALSDPSAYSVIHRDSEEFWDHEAKRNTALESDVYVTQHTIDENLSVINSPRVYAAKIKSRATIRWFPSEQNGWFLITFTRPSSPRENTSFSSHATTRSNPNPVDLASRTPRKDAVTSVNDESSEGDVQGSRDVQLVPGPALYDVPFIVAALDLHGQVVHITDPWYEMTGLTESESLGNGWTSVIHPDDVIGMMTDWGEVLQKQPPNWMFQARIRRAIDGMFCWYLIGSQPQRDESGNVVSWHSTMMDINDWVVTRLETERRRKSMLTLFSKTDVMLWGIDINRRLFLCEGGLDWSPTRLVKLLAMEDTARIRNSEHEEEGKLLLAIREVLAGHSSTPIVEHWEGDRLFRTRFVAERSPPSEGGNNAEPAVQAALALTLDVTEQTARATLRQENQRLMLNERAARDASSVKSRFLANMSHEIRTPISGIIGLIEHLSDCGLNEEQIQFASSIHESAKFLLTLINDILDFSKLESGHMAMESIPFSPKKLIQDLLVPLQLQAEERDLKLSFHCHGSAETILLGDPWRLRQILTNLIGNSLKFTEQGQVTLNVRHTSQVGSRLTVEFIVQDSGVGMSDRTMKSLFKPFSQADNTTARVYGGTGLGLAICNQLVEIMGGQIGLQSETGKGTTATFTVPFSIYAGPTQDLSLSHGNPNPSKKKGSIHRSSQLPNNRPAPKHLDSALDDPDDTEDHVLLVEDNPINRKVIALALRKLGYAVALAKDGQEALDYLRKGSMRPTPSVILMDCMMPIVDGYQATRRIRNDHDMFDEHVRTLPVIALTASAIKGDRERCSAAGMDDYLTKPAAREDLERALSKWMSHAHRDKSPL